MNCHTFRTFEEAMTYIRQHEENTNNKYVIIKRRKRGKPMSLLYVRTLRVTVDLYIKTLLLGLSVPIAQCWINP